MSCEPNLIEWYRALIDGRLGSAQYFEPAQHNPERRDKNCGVDRDIAIVSGEIDDARIQNPTDRF